VALTDEQRAMLQLLLEGGQGYGDIGSLLGIAPDEVRSRARSALREMGGADPDAQVGLSDYLLGQADPIGRADAVRHLQADPEANALAARLIQQLRLLAPKGQLPEIPEPRGGRRAAPPPPATAPSTAAPPAGAPSATPPATPSGPAPTVPPPRRPGIASRVASTIGPRPGDHRDCPDHQLRGRRRRLGRLHSGRYLTGRAGRDPHHQAGRRRRRRRGGLQANRADHPLFGPAANPAEPAGTDAGVRRPDQRLQPGADRRQRRRLSPLALHL
jgi:hypothetical protein